MARADRSAGDTRAARAGGNGGPDDPGRTLRGYRGARRRLVARVAVSDIAGWAAGLMLVLLATSALIAGAFSFPAG